MVQQSRGRASGVLDLRLRLRCGMPAVPMPGGRVAVGGRVQVDTLIGTLRFDVDAVGVVVRRGGV